MSSDNQITSIPSIGSGKKDRGAISVKGKEKKKADLGLFALIAVAILVPVVILIVYISNMGDEEVQVDPESIKTEAIVERNVSDNSNSFKTFIDNVKRENEAEKLPVPPVVVEEKVEVEPPPAVVEEEAKKEEAKKEAVKQESQPFDQVTMMRKLSPVMSPEIESGKSSAGVGTSILDAATEKMGFDTTYDAPTYENGVASVSNRRIRDFLLAHGTNIPCGLESEIISSHAGLVTCIVSSDVYSSNGRTLLVEKGSKVFGNQSVSLEQGQARVFVTWADIQTTEGVRININSLGTGALGASGVEAWVDNHFAERFGGAILLSFLDDAFSALSNKASNQGIEAGESIDNAGSMAEIALENSVNIAPTGYVHIGKRLNIMVARDVDMSTVYGYQKIKRSR